MELQPYHAALHGAEREVYWGPGDLYTFLVTGAQSGGTIFALDAVVGPGGGPPPHRHLAEDEFFYLYEGTVSFKTDAGARDVSVGESIFVPRGTAHSYVNSGTTQASMLTLYTPSGMEGWFREVFEAAGEPALPAPPPTDDMIARMLEAGPRYNVEWVS